MIEDYSHEDSISTLRSVFCEAEKEMHKVENDAQRTPIAALNELRYAASHILSYMESRECDELHQATQHCKRAYYDSQRFLLLYLIRKVQAIRDGMGEYLDIFVELVNKASGRGTYYEIKKRIAAAEKYTLSLAQIKQDSKRWNNREAYYQECLPHIKALKEFIDLYENLREEFMAVCRKESAKKQEQIEAKRLTEQREARKFWLMVIGLVIGLPSAAAAIFAIFSR